jgi:WASH complex subunit strumpellin
MGYILREIIELTNSRSSTFILTAYGFYNCESGKEIINLKTMNILNKCIGVSGLQGLDYLLSIKIMKSIEKLTRLFKKSVEDENIQKVLIRSFNELRSAEAFSNRFDHTLSTLRKHFKLISSSATTEFMRVGHYMLLRDMICLELRLLGKVGSPRLFLVLENLNTSLLNDMIKKQNNPVEG